MNERKNIKPDVSLYVSTGVNIQRLYDVAPEIHSYGLVKQLAQLLLPLKKVKSLEFIGEEAQQLINTISKRQESQRMDWADVAMVRSYVDSWTGRLKEISKGWIVSCPQTHINAGKLVEGPKAFLSDEEFNMLEPLEIHGLTEAASSLLFDNFTSAEFVALRTAESLLKKWYEKKTGKKLRRTTWGAVLEKLNREFPNERERPKELLLLDYLRERRNEIAHAEAVSNSVQASTTFLNVISLCQTLYFK